MFLDFKIVESLQCNLKRLFTFHYHIHSYITHSSEVLNMHKGKTTRFDTNSLSFDEDKLWNKSYFEWIYRKTNLTKSKLKTLLEISFLSNYV